MSLLQSVVLVLVLLQLGETHQAEQEGGQQPLPNDSGARAVRAVSREEFDEVKERLEQKVEDLQRELDLWQNTTIHILKKCLVNGIDADNCGQCGNGDQLNELQEKVEGVEEATTNYSREVTTVLSQCLGAITTLQEKVDRVEGKVDRVEGKVDRVEEKVDGVEGKVDRVEEKVCRIEEASNNHSRKVWKTLAHVDQQLTTLVLNGTNGLFQACNNLPAGSPSGMYRIQSPRNGNATQVYCDMTRECCGSRGGWMRVAHLDMTDPNQHCPLGFRLITSPRRMCGRSGPGCVSTTFPVHGVEYRKVCGKVIGYQYGSPDAFQTGTDSIDSHYVDGVSITHGQSPRKHMWTFAVALDEIATDRSRCPCTRPDLNYTETFPIPSFVGQDYFCETGSRSRYPDRYMYYTEDPLWDSMGCGSNSTCCSFNNPPWFCKELPQPTTDDIELRICATASTSDEDSPIKLVELYVQ